MSPVPAFILALGALAFLVLHFRYMRICTRYGLPKRPHYFITGFAFVGSGLIGWMTMALEAAK